MPRKLTRSLLSPRLCALYIVRDTESHPKKKSKKEAKATADDEGLAAARALLQSKVTAVAATTNGEAPPGNLSDYEKCSIFPQKLMQLLKNNENPDAIWWLEDGESFALEPEQFTKVMNKVSRTSKKQVKLDSILRNLYRWGFKKLKDRDLPPNVLAYSHPKFKRDACVELQTFSKKTDASSANHTTASSSNDMHAMTTSPALAASAATGAAPSALAKALSARAQAGYGENWNDEGAADKMSLAMQQQQSQWMFQQAYGGAGGAALAAGTAAGGEQSEEQQRMFQSMMLQQQQQQRQMLLQQELFLHERQRHHQQQTLLLEAAAAEHAAAQQYAAQRLAASGGLPYPPASYPPY